MKPREEEIHTASSCMHTAKWLLENNDFLKRNNALEMAIKIELVTAIKRALVMLEKDNSAGVLESIAKEFAHAVKK